MTDHREAAAAHAVELAEEMMRAYDRELEDRYRHAAVHFMYMAGLLRAPVAAPTPEPNGNTYTPSRSGQRRATVTDEGVRLYPSSGTGYEKIQDVESVELAALRAERGRAGEEIMRLQRLLNVREIDFQQAKLAHAAELAELRDQVKKLNDLVTEGEVKQRRLTDQRNDLLDAARCVIAPRPGRDYLELLRETTERVMRQCATPAEQAARLRVE